MEAAPYHIYSRYKILYCRLFLSNIYISNPLCVLCLILIVLRRRDTWRLWDNFCVISLNFGVYGLIFPKSNKQDAAAQRRCGAGIFADDEWGAAEQPSSCTDQAV